MDSGYSKTLLTPMRLGTRSHLLRDIKYGAPELQWRTGALQPVILFCQPSAFHNLLRFRAPAGPGFRVDPA